MNKLNYALRLGGQIKPHQLAELARALEEDGADIVGDAATMLLDPLFPISFLEMPGSNVPENVRKLIEKFGLSFSYSNFADDGRSSRVQISNKGKIEIFSLDDDDRIALPIDEMSDRKTFDRAQHWSKVYRDMKLEVQGLTYLLNCAPSKEIGKFMSQNVSLEINPCKNEGTEDDTAVTVCVPDEAEFWTVYGHDKDGYAVAISDQPSKITAEAAAAQITEIWPNLKLQTPTPTMIGIRNVDRRKWAEAAIASYMEMKSYSKPLPEDTLESASDLFTDLTHAVAELCDGDEEKTIDQVTSALRHWIAEHRNDGEPIAINPNVSINVEPIS